MVFSANIGFARFVLVIIGLLGLTFVSASAQAEVTWDILGTDSQGGEPDLTGTVTTPDIEFNCSLGPPASCPISGTLTIPAGVLGGPGTTIDLGVDPANVIISISASPPASGDDFFVFDISKDGYDCTTSSSLVLQCDFDLTTASYDLELTEQVPKVVLGNGNVLITGQLEVAGQIIAPAEPALYEIGGTGPAGGFVFYVTTDGLRGLEAAPTDQSSDAKWGCYATAITGADDLAVGTGAQNTGDILTWCMEPGIGARIAANYSVNGYSDWYLPSIDELALMYDNIGLGNTTDPNVGGFAFDCYWSSSEANAFNAWCQGFGDLGDTLDIYDKTRTFSTRAVRAF